MHPETFKGAATIKKVFCSDSAKRKRCFRKRLFAYKKEMTHLKNPQGKNRSDQRRNDKNIFGRTNVAFIPGINKVGNV